MAKLNEEYFERIEQFIIKYKSDKGRSPSFREMVDRLNIPKTTLTRYMQIMRERGIIDYDGSRNILTWDEIHNEGTDEIAHEGGDISCGMPQQTDGRFDSSVKLPSSLFGKGPFFILTANGNSMIDAGINPGDKVLLRFQSVAENGDIVAAYVPDQDGLTLKRFYKDEKHKRFILHPENDELEDQIYDNVVIQGVLVNVIKDASALRYTSPDWNSLS